MINFFLHKLTLFKFTCNNHIVQKVSEFKVSFPERIKWQQISTHYFWIKNGFWIIDDKRLPLAWAAAAI